MHKFIIHYTMIDQKPIVTQMEKKHLYQPTTYRSITHYEARSFTIKTKGEHRKSLTRISTMAYARLEAVGITRDHLKDFIIDRDER